MEARFAAANLEDGLSTIGCFGGSVFGMTDLTTPRREAARGREG